MTASQELQGQTRNMALLIDGDNALLHAYHTTSGWTTSKGVGQTCCAKLCKSLNADLSLLTGAGPMRSSQKVTPAPAPRAKCSRASSLAQSPISGPRLGRLLAAAVTHTSKADSRHRHAGAPELRILHRVSDLFVMWPYGRVSRAL